jgi:hypothetical protein
MGYTKGMSGVLYRNVRARDHLEIFLLSAASSLLLIRFYLHITGYPQIGSGGLHIAHMLWGGILMMVAISMALSFVGARVQRITAIVGGIGFGVFIDEIGKFITRDNNYFFKPAIGIIYAIFIVLYLIFNFMSRTRPLTSREYQLNALGQLEEAIVKDMDPAEKFRVQQLIHRADANDALTKQLQKFLDNVRTIPAEQPSRVSQLLNRIGQTYMRFWQRKDSNRLVRLFFLAEVVIFVVGIAVSGNTYSNIHGILNMSADAFSYSSELAIGQLAASLAAAGFAIWGAILLPTSRLRAYEQFRRATLVNIFLTQFFMFTRIEFEALPGFFFNVALLGIIGYAIRQEERNRRKD